MSIIGLKCIIYAGKMHGKFVSVRPRKENKIQVLRSLLEVSRLFSVWLFVSPQPVRFQRANLHRSLLQGK